MSLEETDNDELRDRSAKAASYLQAMVVVAYHPVAAYLGAFAYIETETPLALERGGEVLGAGVLDDTKLSRSHGPLAPRAR